MRPEREGNVYVQGGQTYYGTFTGLINNQAISQNYTNSAGGPVVAFASATYLKNSANSNYNSLQASVNRRFSHNVQAQVSYTWGKCTDDGSFVGSFNNNANNPDTKTQTAKNCKPGTYEPLCFFIWPTTCGPK